MFAIYCLDTSDYLREPASRAILVWETKTQACSRAAKHYGVPTYGDAKRAGRCILKEFVAKAHEGGKVKRSDDTFATCVETSLAGNLRL